MALLFTSWQDLGIAMLVGLGVGTVFALFVRPSRRLFRRWSVSQSPEYASYAYTIAAMVVLLVYAGLDGASWPLLAAFIFLAVTCTTPGGATAGSDRLRPERPSGRRCRGSAASLRLERAAAGHQDEARPPCRRVDARGQVRFR